MSMKSILIVFFIVGFLLMLIMFPFKIKVMAHLDLISMKCFYCFKVWRIKVLCGRAKIDGEKQVIVENSDNLVTLNLNKDFISILIKTISKKIEVKKVKLFFTGGFVEDSYASALVCGSVSAITKAVYSILSQTYKNVEIYEDVTPTFNETNLDVSVKIGLCVSLFSVLVSLIKADRIKTKQRKMEVKNEG